VLAVFHSFGTFTSDVTHSSKEVCLVPVFTVVCMFVLRSSDMSWATCYDLYIVFKAWYVNWVLLL